MLYGPIRERLFSTEIVAQEAVCTDGYSVTLDLVHYAHAYWPLLDC